MKSSYPRKVAIITGDLARSSSLPQGEITRAMRALSDLFETEQHWVGENFTRQSGDGWQVVVPNFEGAIRSTLTMRATLRSLGPEFEAYFSIAVGDLLSAPPTNLNDTNEQIFVKSGRELQILKERAQKDGVMVCHWSWGGAASVAVLADHISQKWTPPQAAAMRIYLNPFSDEITYTEAAERLGISRQAVTKSLKAAGKDAILKSLFILEAALRGQAEEQRP